MDGGGRGVISLGRVVVAAGWRMALLLALCAIPPVSSGRGPCIQWQLPTRVPLRDRLGGCHFIADFLEIDDRLALSHSVNHASHPLLRISFPLTAKSRVGFAF